MKFTVLNGVWRQFELAPGMRSKQIPYQEIVKVLKHIMPDTGSIGGVSIEKVRQYFKDFGYKTATKNRVSVDELVSTFGTPIKPTDLEEEEYDYYEDDDE